MNTQRITESEISTLKVSSLPTRPTAPASFGGRGYTSSDMKAAFDRLPLYIIERLNSLIDDIGAEGEESVASAVRTGIADGHTLLDLFEDIGSGAFSAYLTVFGVTLTEYLAQLRSEIDSLKEKIR